MQFLYNTDIVVGIAFVIFLAILLYYRVPGMLTRRLDERAERIRAELEEARALREEAQSLLASYERKQKDVRVQADEIVAAARRDAEKAAESAKEDIRNSVSRRLKTATEQIEAAEQAAVRQIKDRAVAVAIAAAADAMRQNMDAKLADQLIDASIRDVGQKLH
jgi:F-type H+-transporting ATPase subunit b